MPRYVIDYGQPSTGTAEIAGFGGRAIFDSDTAVAIKACGSAALMCQAPVVSGRPNVWYERELRVGDSLPATARHQDCCPGPVWALTWYDPGSDTTYRLQLSGAAAVLSADPATADAAMLVSIATGLVRLK